MQFMNPSKIKMQSIMRFGSSHASDGKTYNPNAYANLSLFNDNDN